ncbi:hypothetical protein F4821DRAFT_240574 [Hypoxylon rubiginosum]|uniref:Uncharacterized protein n=1 Tax=Hypoxylon rubiginosum TaxID=110542 RepID=A0ACC0CYG6_9PEZI|nr:hypothetical protein F4821DRAFT_240574 [Hypoxylon rubiginosum]
MNFSLFIFLPIFGPSISLILICFRPLICCFHPVCLVSSADPKNTYPSFFFSCVSIPCSSFTLISAFELDVLNQAEQC